MTRLQRTLRRLSDMRRLYLAMSQAKIELPHTHTRQPKSFQSSVEAHRRVAASREAMLIHPQIHAD